MSYEVYKKYYSIDSDFLIKLPSSWQSKRLKFTLSSRLKYGANEAAELDDRSLPRYIRITDIDDKGNLREDTFRSIPFEIANEYLLQDGDLLLARSGATVGKSYFFKGNWGQAAYAGYLIRARFGKLIHKKFAHYFFSSDSYWSWLKSVFIQSTIQNVSAEKYSDIVVPIPTLPEQQTIAKFLDYKTAQIDSLIEKKEQLLKFLEEKRIALITNAVTGRIPSLREGKKGWADSGIPWLGEIPKHWKVKKLKYVTKCNVDSLNESTEPDYLFQYVDISSVDYLKGIKEKTEVTFENAPSRARRKVQTGDTIISTVRTYLKAIALIEKDASSTIASTGFAVIHPLDSLNNKFAYYFIQSIGFVETVSAFSKGVSYPAIDSTELITIPIVVPPLREQENIVTCLDKEFLQIDQLSAKVTEAIEKLKEYRTSLITSAVTGKIDLRNWQHPATACTVQSQSDEAEGVN